MSEFPKKEAPLDRRVLAHFRDEGWLTAERTAFGWHRSPMVGEDSFIGREPTHWTTLPEDPLL